MTTQDRRYNAPALLLRTIIIAVPVGAYLAVLLAAVIVPAVTR